MIHHIVVWKLKDSAEGASREENIVRMKAALEGLQDKVPSLLRIEAGGNVTADAAAWDFALYSEFATRDDLASYQKHPAHVVVSQFIGKLVERRAVVDYEV